MKHFLFFICLLLLTTAAFAKKPAKTTAFADVKLARIIDGDTFTVYLPCSYKIFCKDISVRVRGINAPEVRTKNKEEKAKGLKAKEFAKSFLEGGQVDLLKCTRGKYFRMICDVTVDGEDYATAILKAGLAKPS